jgi:hypothetical protein
MVTITTSDLNMSTKDRSYHEVRYSWLCLK